MEKVQEWVAVERCETIKLVREMVKGMVVVKVAEKHTIEPLKIIIR